ncbi:MAG: hypothetical protein N3D71_08395 [Burkholderiaceae bacterium]|nr:hypothetical protein [Burkholderiaceae bacterium]
MRVGLPSSHQRYGMLLWRRRVSGFAWSQVRADRSGSREAAPGYLRRVAAAANVPIDADFERGFTHDPVSALPGNRDRGDRAGAVTRIEVRLPSGVSVIAHTRCVPEYELRTPC